MTIEERLAAKEQLRKKEQQFREILVDSIAETITIYFAFGDTVTHKIVFKKKPR